MSWSEFSASAVAVFPYNSDASNHLKLIAGDVLEITEKCGDWVRAKCHTTSCIGICPFNHLHIIEKGNDTFDLLQIETKYILEYVLSKCCDPTAYPTPQECEILENTTEILACFPPKSQESRKIISKSIDKIRELLDFPKVLRNKQSCIVRTHDINYHLFSTLSSGSTGALQSDAIYPATSLLVVQMQFKYTKNVRVSVRLVNTKLKNSSIFAPTDVVVEANSGIVPLIKFHNIDPTRLGDIALVVRIFTDAQFGQNSNGPWANEYIGTAVQMLIPPDDNSLQTGDTLEKILSFYEENEGSQANTMNDLIKGEYSELKRLDEVPQLVLSVTAIDMATKASNALVDTSILPMDYPINICPDYPANSLFLHMIDLHHKTKFKRTRVVVRVFNLLDKKYLPIFKKTRDPTMFATVVQKGSMDMPIDEIAELDLNTPGFIPDSCKLIFEVQRTSRSKGAIHLSSIAKFPIFNETFIESTDKKPIFEVALHKPPKENMTAEDYFTSVSESETKEKETVLKISLKLCSMKYTSNLAIERLLHYKENRDKLLAKDGNGLESISLIDHKILQIFLNRILISLAGIISEDNQELRTAAQECFISIIKEVDQSRGGIFKLFFEEFSKNDFKRDNYNLAKLYNPMLRYLDVNLPNSTFIQQLCELSNDKEKMMSPSNVQTLKKGEVCCRCLTYILQIISSSLQLCKELNEPVDEEQFKTNVRNVFEHINTLMTFQLDILLISQSFTAKSFPMFCDIVQYSLESEETNKYILKFLEAARKSSNTTSQINLRAIRLRLYQGLSETEYFKKESNRRAFCNILIDDLMDLHCKFNQLDKKESKNETYPILQRIFFIMMQTSSSFSQALKPFANHFQLFFDKGYSPNFIVLLLYFAEPKVLADMFLKADNKPEMYNTALDTVYRLLTSDPPPFIFFVCSIAFNRVVLLSQLPEFDFVHSNLKELIDLISNFYNDFMITFSQFTDFDQTFYRRIYFISLEPIAALLPTLLKSAPTGMPFNEGVLLPLFHFYITQTDPQTRQNVVDGFYLLTESDLANEHNFQKSENAVIHAMDQISASKTDITVLRELFNLVHEKYGSKKNYTQVSSFFKRCEQLTVYFYDLGRFPAIRKYEDERSTAIISVLDSCKKNNDFALYPHFINKLLQLNIIIKNNVEAAETCLLCANLYDWNDAEMLPHIHSFKAAPKYERKLDYVTRAIKRFISDSFYERAIESIEQVCFYYREVVGDALALSKYSEMEASCYQMMCFEERPNLNRFYGVQFFGDKFSEYYKNATYIYRRNGFYDAGQMMHELKDKFVEAEVQPKPPSDEELKKPDLYYIYVFNVKPKDYESFDALESPATIMVKTCCNVTEFFSNTPVRIRRTDAKYNEMAEWHRHVVKYTTGKPLQGAARRALVIKTSETIVMTPIECAVIDTSQKTLELMQVAATIWRYLRFGIDVQPQLISNFARQIQGIVNAAVNGGTQVFQNLFLESPLKDEPINKKFAPALIISFKDQLKAVNFSLKIHNALSNLSEVDVELHKNWEESFKNAIESMSAVCGKIDLNEQPTFGEIPSTDFLLSNEEKEKEKVTE